MFDSDSSYIETLEIEQWKLSRNSNGHKLSEGGFIQAHHISRRSKYNNGTFREIQMVLSSQMDVRFGDIIYRDALNRTTEPLEKFKWS